MVFLYVKGADDRAKAEQEPVEVLKAVAQIEPGESLAQAQAAGKLQIGEVPREQALVGAVNSISGMDTLVALTRIYPSEQIIAAKFGSPGEQDTLNIPEGNIAISVNLSDTGRVAGFVSPGANVAIFLTSQDAGGGVEGTRLLLAKVQVIAVAQTTVTTSTTTDPEGGATTTETLPKTLITLSVSQEEAQRLMYAATHGELSFGLLNDKSQVKPGPAVTGSNLFAG